MKKILHILEPFNPGGVTWWLIDIAKFLHEKEYIFEFVCIGTEKGMRGDEVELMGCKIHTWEPSIPNVIGGFKLRNIIKNTKCDIIHSHPFNLSGWILWHAYKVGVPIRIAHFHNTSVDHPKTLRKTIGRYAGRHLIQNYATHLLACSETALEHAPSINISTNRQILHYGVDLKRLRNSLPGKLRNELKLSEVVPIFGHVGRFYKQKNHFGLIRIFKHIINEIPQAHLVLCGDGPLQKSVEQFVRRQGLTYCVHFLGQRLDIPELMADFDVFLFPSFYEGLGLVLVEAASAGIPIVAPALKACEEALSGANGYKIVSYDDEKSFASAALELLNKKPVQQFSNWLNAWNKNSSSTNLSQFYKIIFQNHIPY